MFIPLMNITKTELLEAALRGLTMERDRIELFQTIIRKKLAGEVYTLPTGQPCCPEHGSDYEEGICTVCQELTGTLPQPKPPNAKGHHMSASGRKRISLAARRRWMKWNAQKRKILADSYLEQPDIIGGKGRR